MDVLWAAPHTAPQTPSQINYFYLFRFMYITLFYRLLIILKDYNAREISYKTLGDSLHARPPLHHSPLYFSCSLSLCDFHLLPFAYSYDFPRWPPSLDPQAGGGAAGRSGVMGTWAGWCRGRGCRSDEQVGGSWWGGRWKTGSLTALLFWFTFATFPFFKLPFVSMHFLLTCLPASCLTLNCFLLLISNIYSFIYFCFYSRRLLF